MTLSRKIILSLLASLGGCIAVHAQEFKVPASHAAIHQDLIASQANIGNQIKVEVTEQFLEGLLNEEDIEPEIDIYTEGWNSKRVNPYGDAVVPDTKDIDVSVFAMPHPGYVTSNYGYRRRFRREHKGIDIKAITGDTIRSAFNGKIRLTSYDRRGYGNYIIIRHENGLETVYGHLSKILISEDQYVKAGDPIGLAGNTGRSFGSHLHFETRYMGIPINPAAIFDFSNQTTHTDIYTFDKRTYKKARNYSDAANRQYMAKYREEHKEQFAAASKKASKGNGTTYRIRRGDSLGKIAARNGVSVKQLCRLNGLKTTSKLQIGQVIRLR